jgi:hypothetical protein
MVEWFSCTQYSPVLGGGGGGATTAGSTVVPNNPLNTPVSFSGPGGNGATSSINGTSTVARAGGGGEVEHILSSQLLME